MWVFTNSAFVSAAAHRSHPGMLMVRARLRGDLEQFLSACVADLAVEETPSADYRFRCVVRMSDFATAVQRAIKAIDYDNFKGSIAHAEWQRHDAYLDVWSAMHNAQSSHEGNA